MTCSGHEGRDVTAVVIKRLCSASNDVFSGIELVCVALCNSVVDIDPQGQLDYPRGR